MTSPPALSFFFFFNDTATTEIYTLSLHDALPISLEDLRGPRGAFATLGALGAGLVRVEAGEPHDLVEDRKSTRLNSSHDQISYAVFCLKKKKTQEMRHPSSAHTTSMTFRHYDESD